MHDRASTTQNELAGILVATEILLNQGSGIIPCDPESDPQAQNTFDRSASNNADDFRINVHHAEERGHVIYFVCCVLYILEYR